MISICWGGPWTCLLGGVKLRGLREGPPKGSLPPPLLGSLPRLLGLTGYPRAQRSTACWAGSFNTTHNPSSPKGISPSPQKWAVVCESWNTPSPDPKAPREVAPQPGALPSTSKKKPLGFLLRILTATSTISESDGSVVLFLFSSYCKSPGSKRPEEEVDGEFSRDPARGTPRKEPGCLREHSSPHTTWG